VLRMGCHDFTLAAGEAGVTSAEPTPAIPPAWPEDALRICKEAVFADAIAGKLADTPLLSVKEAQLVAFLLREKNSELRVRAFLCFLGLMAEWRRRTDAHAWFVAEAEKVSREDVRRAALRVEQAVQEWLWAFGGPGATVRDRSWGDTLAGAQSQAHRAVVARYGTRKAAKEIQRAASGSREPLTVCHGRKLRRLPNDVVRRVAPTFFERYPDGWLSSPHGDGCGMIIFDSALDRHPKRYCDSCEARAGLTLNAGLAKSALARLRKNWGVGRV
jgi:hypothetical protein